MKTLHSIIRAASLMTYDASRVFARQSMRSSNMNHTRIIIRRPGPLPNSAGAPPSWGAATTEHPKTTEITACAVPAAAAAGEGRSDWRGRYSRILTACLARSLFGLACLLLFGGLAPVQANTFTTIAPMPVPALFQTATSLSDGRVMVCGGQTALSGTYSIYGYTQFYDPATGTWSLGSSILPRSSHAATLLANGWVLITGGQGDGLVTDQVIYNPTDNVVYWAGTNHDLFIPRLFHTSTRLKDGRVLVVGGRNDSSALASAQLFDVVSFAWTNTGSLSHPRALHTATLLPNGKVLVAGGWDIANVLSSAELYDPITGTWSDAASLASARDYHTATLLPDGRVLVAAGKLGDNSLASAEIYNPTNNTWIGTGSAPVGRQFHTATLLPNGQVAVIGGAVFSGNEATLILTAELYNPATGTWTNNGNLATSRMMHTASLLPDGQVLVPGGFGLGNSVVASAELYTSTKDSWNSVSSLAGPRQQQASALLTNGLTLVAGGYNGTNALATAQLFNPATSNWVNTGSLGTARYGHTLTVLPNGLVLAAGGFNGANALTNAELYNPATGLWTTTGPLATSRTYHAATLLLNGKVIVTGGLNASVVAAAEIYDPATGLWTSTGSLGFGRYYHSATLLPNGRLLISGGYGTPGGGYLAAAELYNVSTGQFTPTGSNVLAVAAHTATLLPNGRVLAAGGIAPGGSVLRAELYNPVTGTWTSTALPNQPRALHTATLLPGGQVLLAGGGGVNSSAELYDPATATWTPTALFAQGSLRYQTAILQTNGLVLVAGGNSAGAAVATAQTYNPGLGFSNAWRPRIATGTFYSDGEFDLDGTGFTGISEASGGNGAANAPSDHPVVQLRRLDNEQSTFLSAHPDYLFSDTNFYSAPVPPFGRGPMMVTVFANGIPSSSRLVNFPGYPAISVEQPGSLIANGGTASFSNLLLASGIVMQSITFTINNPGGDDLTGLTLTKDGPNAADFIITSNPVAPVTAGGSTTFTVLYTQTNAGPRSAAIHIANNVVGQDPFDINLSGQFLSPAILVYQPAATPRTNGSNVGFTAYVTTTNTPQTLTFTIRNQGTYTLSGINIIKDGANAGDFTITSYPASQVAPGAATTFAVQFAPTSGGTKHAAIHIANNAPGNTPYDLNLTGGALAPSIRVEQPVGSPIPQGGSADFAANMVGTNIVSNEVTFAIINSGTLFLTGLTLTMDGPNAADFTITQNPSDSVNPYGGATFFKVRFAPATAGSVRSATIHIANNVRGSNPFNINLTGRVLMTTGADDLATGRAFQAATLLPNGKVLVTGGTSNGVSALASAALYDPATGAWNDTAPLAAGRWSHTATLLPNGKVLVAGGTSNGASALASAALYDPATGAWSNTGSLIAGRWSHTATLLPNGKVLVAGGTANGTTALTSAELYDPANGTWSNTGTLLAGCWSHTATLLSNGKVLVAGGTANGITALTGAELYDPASGAWSNTGALGAGRWSHTATLLPNSKVLAAGGTSNGSGGLASSELYDPATGLWSGTGSFATARQRHTATLMPNGQVLAAGGDNATGPLLNAENYDQTSGTWLGAGQLLTPRRSHTATLLLNGQLLLAGGQGSTGPLASAELSLLQTNVQWSASAFVTERGSHTATLLPNGRVLVAGGVNSNGVVTSASLYNPATRTWSATGTLITGRQSHTATLLSNGKVLVAGGRSSANIGLASAELYDPATGIWSATGSLATGRLGHTATILSNGKVLVTGGTNNASGVLASAELYDPAAGTWSATGPLATARQEHTATLLQNGQVLVAGGGTANAELYNPATGTWSATGPLTYARQEHTATLLPNGQVLVSGGIPFVGITVELYDPATGTWSGTGWLHTSRWLHTATLLPSGKVLIAGGQSTPMNIFPPPPGPVTARHTAELYDPATGNWSAVSDFVTARFAHTATLLPNGQVLIAGGYGGLYYDSNYLAIAESCDFGLGFNPAWQPQIASASFDANGRLVLTGSGFRGISSASGGNGAQDSPTSYPLVEMLRLDNEQSALLLSDPATSVSSNAFTSVPVPITAAGYVMVTVFANGIPSSSSLVYFPGRVGILVEQPAGNPIPSGGSVSFGSIVLQTTSNLTFTIRNPGSVNLTGLTITKDGANAPDFLVTANPTAPVAPGGTTTFTIQFAPTNTTGLRSAAIHIANNVAGSNPYNINLTGTATPNFVAPTVVTMAASALTPNGATLNGTVNPGNAATVCYFQYGTTTNYGSLTPNGNLSAGTTPLAVSNTISGLSALTLYHFRLVATNSAGTNFGSDLTLTTPANNALGTTNLVVGPAAGTNSIVLWSYGGSWTASSNAAWLHISAGTQSGTASTNVIFTFDANAGGTRTGTLTVAAVTVNVTQAGSNYVAVTEPTTLVGAGLEFSGGVAVDAARNVYISDFGDNTLKKWSRAIGLVTLVTNGLNSPYGLAVDATGNVYIADGYNNAIKKWAPANNSVSTVITGLNTALGVAVDRSGIIYVADTFNNAIRKWNGLGLSNVITSGLSAPYDVAVDAAGNLYVVDTFNNALKKWSAASQSVTTLAGSGLNHPDGVAVDGSGNVYIADTLNDEVKQWNAASKSVIPLVASGTYQPAGVTVDTAGNLFFVDGNGTARELPRAFVVPTPRIELASAGSDSLPAAVPANIDFTGPFLPDSDQPWLTITGVTNGVVSFSFTANTSGYRTATINMLGVSILISQLAAPTVTTLAAGPVSSTKATLNGTVNPNGAAATVYFQYGLTTNYGSFSATNALAATNADFSLSNLVSSLTPSTAYHFRLVGINSQGSRTGADLTFTTPSGFVVGTTNLAVGPAAGSNSVALASVGGSWTALANAPWLHISAGTVSGTASTNVIFTFDANAGATRTGTLTIAGNSVSITQAGSNYVAVGVATTLVGSGLSSPAGVAVDGARNVYLCDSGNNTVQKWTAANNTVSTLVSNGLNTPYGVAVDAAGNFYIADANNNAVKKWIASSQTVGTLFGGLLQPLGVAVDGAGIVYVADTFNNAVRKWNGVGLSNVITSGLNAPYGVAVDIAGNLYVVDTFNNALKKWSAASQSVSTLAGSGLNHPDAAAVDGSGNVYIADTLNNAVKQWHAASQSVLTLVGSGIFQPAGVAADAAGNVYFQEGSTIKELPRAFVVPTPRSEPSTAGSDSLPVVVPTAADLTGPFLPTSDQPWLTITGVTNGVVSFSFTANTWGSNRVANINLLGVSIPVTSFAAAPSVTTLAGGGITPTNATLNGTVNPNGAATTVYFRYGLTTNYGGYTATNTLPATNVALSVSRLISNLTPGTTYHFRLVASSSVGASLGNDLTLITPPTSPYGQAVLADQPIGYWRLDETNGSIARDFFGANNGFYTNVLLGQPGNANVDSHTAVKFGSVSNLNSYVGGVPIGFATPGNATFSVECWANGGPQTNDSGIITRGNGGGEQFNLDCGSAGHAFRFFVRDASGGAHLANGTLAPDNSWHHLVGVCDQANGKVFLYVDGIANASGTIFPGIGLLSSANATTFGSRQSTTSAYDLQFVGSLEEVAIYTNALSPAQVLAHYQAAARHPVISSVKKAGTNLILTVTNGTPGGGWTSLATTNLATPIQWITNATGTFDGQGKVTLTNAILPTQPRRFFFMRTP